MPLINKALPIFVGVIIFFALVEMIQVAVLVGSYNRNNDYIDGSYKGSLRFTLFTSIWTLFISAGYLAAFMLAPSSVVASVASFVGFAALTWLFWIASAGSLTASMGGGLHCGEAGIAHCYQLQSALAFSWIEFIFFALLVILVGYLAFRSVRNGNGITGQISA